MNVRWCFLFLICACVHGQEISLDSWPRAGLPVRITAFIPQELPAAAVSIEQGDLTCVEHQVGVVPAGVLRLALTVSRQPATSAPLVLWLRSPGFSASSTMYPASTPVIADPVTARFEAHRQRLLAGLLPTRPVLAARAATCGWTLTRDPWGIAATRLTRFPGAIRRALVIRLDPRTSVLEWPLLPESSRRAAQLAGTDIVELLIPGGYLEGVANLRLANLARHVDLVLGPNLDDKAMSLTEQWLPQLDNRPQPQSFIDACPEWVRPGIVVVVGPGQHRAAQLRIEVLAQAFAQDWRDHSGDEPERVQANDVDPSRFPGQTVVCLGGPRDNPHSLYFSQFIVGDHREQWLTISPQRSWYWVQHPGLVMFAGDRILLDGPVSWRTIPNWASGRLPLAGLPRLFIGGGVTNGNHIPGHAR